MPDATSKTSAADPAQECLDFLAQHRDIRFVDILLTDACGVQRGKRIPVGELERIWRNGRFMPGSIISLDITGADVEETGLVWEDGDADRSARPIPGTLVPVPWKAEPSAQVLLTLFELDGSPSAYDPRQVLARVVSRLAADGLHPVVAVELEFYLVDRKRGEDGRPRPPVSPVSGKRQDTTQVYGIDELHDFHELLHEIYDTCVAQGIPVDSLVSEYAPGQYEINLRHVSDPLEACDDAVLFKRVVRSVAAKHGVEATFMAKPYPDQAGSGFHIHMSMLDDNGVSLFAADDPHGTPMLRHAIGGLGATMADGMAVFAQNQNSFRRFQPNSYVPHAPTWAANNRSVSLRIPPGKPKDRRVEHRVAGADCNPYLVVAAVLAGVHHGIKRQIDPGPPIQGNAYDKVEPTLTSSWIVALEQLDGSAFFNEYFGRRFLDVYLALKWAERDKFFSQITQLEYDWYLNKV
jgi:glutamine synthetase